jgi:hypothetical protein
MRVRAWRGGTFGISVGRPNAAQHFGKGLRSINVEIDGEFYGFRLSRKFWTTCPEFRGSPIPGWLKSQGLDRWPRRRPHVFELEALGEDKYRLHRGVKDPAK